MRKVPTIHLNKRLNLFSTLCIKDNPTVYTVGWEHGLPYIERTHAHKE